MAALSPGRPDRSARARGGRPRRPELEEPLSTVTWQDGPPDHLTHGMDRDVVVDCGWGRVVFGQTFDEPDRLLAVLREEKIGRRDVCLYPRDPHVLVSRAPQELFLDPSHTYRLRLHRHRSSRDPARGIVVRSLRDEADAEAMNRLLSATGMVPAQPDTVWENQRTRDFTYLVAEDADTGNVVGTVTGIDHVRVFGDPEEGASLWSLAVDPQATKPGLGQALVLALAEGFQARGRAYLDLSVMWDNEPAITLYEKLGFERVPVFAIKRKNPINEPLFSAPPAEELEGLNPYARIIADEAIRRGVTVEVLDATAGYLRLSHGGRSIVTRESLSELTSAVAMSRCDDKQVTKRVLAAAGVQVPRGRQASFDEDDVAFLDDVGEVVVKPVRGEQGTGVTVGVRHVDGLAVALDRARSYCPDVLIEEYVEGRDLRVVVIDHDVVAAAERRPPSVLGDGVRTVEALIRAQSRRRASATGGESQIPVDEQTRETLAARGRSLDDVPARGERILVRRTANLHTGGTIHDVTARLHPVLAGAAISASRALDIPVVGIDLLVDEVDDPEYVVIEANERPGLANHEPQPTAQRFIDLLFPGTRAVPGTWEPGPHPRGLDHQVT